MANNTTVIYMPWRVSKNDAVDPSITSVSISQTEMKNNNVIDQTPFITHTSAEALHITVTSGFDKKVLTFKLKADDNHEVANVYVLDHPNDAITLSTPVLAGPDGDGFYTINREYLFSDYDGFGSRFVENVYLVVVDETGNRKTHDIPVYLNREDVTDPVISLAITSENDNELQYPTQTLSLIATATVSDSASGVATDTVKQFGAINGWTELGIQNDGTYQWNKVVSWRDPGQPSRVYTEEITVEAKDNADNRTQETATFNYTISSNHNINLVNNRIDLRYQDDDNNSIVKTVTVDPWYVDPDKAYEADFVITVNDPTTLQDPVANDVIIKINGNVAPADALVVSELKRNGGVAGGTGNQEYNVRVAFNTSGFNKGDGVNNTVSVELTIKDNYTQSRTFTLSQNWRVWNYETIDLDNDYYYIYEADMQKLITNVKDENGNITGYQMTSRTSSFNHLSYLRVNLPGGSASVAVEPFKIEKRRASNSEEVENTYYFALTSEILATSSGIVDAFVEVEDKSINVSYIDDFNLAQVIFSNFDNTLVDENGDIIHGGATPDVKANTADVLNRLITKDYLTKHPVINATINDKALPFISSSAPSVGLVSLSEIPTGDSLDQLCIKK